MKMNITSTQKITTIDGVPVRLWEGVTEAGVPCHVFVHRVAVHVEDDCIQFEKELKEQLQPGQFVALNRLL